MLVYSIDGLQPSVNYSDSDLKSETHIFTRKVLGRRNILNVYLEQPKNKNQQNKTNNRHKIFAMPSGGCY